MNPGNCRREFTTWVDSIKGCFLQNDWHCKLSYNTFYILIFYTSNLTLLEDKTAIASSIENICCSIITWVFLWILSGPSPDADFVISVCLQSNIPSATGKSGTASLPLQSGPAPSTSDLSDSSKFRPRDRQPGKRKDMDSTWTFTYEMFMFFLLMQHPTICLFTASLLHQIIILFSFTLGM